MWHRCLNIRAYLLSITCARCGRFKRPSAPHCLLCDMILNWHNYS